MLTYNACANVGNLGRCGTRSGGEVELLESCLALTIAEAAEPTSGGDLQFGHEFLCFDFSDLRQCGEHLRDPVFPTTSSVSASLRTCHQHLHSVKIA